MFPRLLQNNLLHNQSKLYVNQLQLMTESSSTTLINGTPETTVTQTQHWAGYGSIQYVRPRIQKSVADEYGGTMEDPISLVAYVPYEAMPTEGMVVIDVDGVIDGAGKGYRQSRKPANVGGADVYWEVYLGLEANG